MVQEDDEHVIHGLEPLQPLWNNTLGVEILKNLLENDPDEDVMVDAVTRETLSRRALLEAACNTAEALLSYGCTTSTVISVSSENNFQFYIPVLGALLIGTTVAPVNHNYTPFEMRHIMGISKPRIIFCSAEISPKLIELKKELPYLDKIVIIDSNRAVPGAETLEEFVGKALGGRRVLPERFQPFAGDPATSGAFILCSSGTTGMPKGVWLSHRNLMGAMERFRDPRFHYSGTKDWLGLMPFFHGYGLCVGLNVIINNRRIVVIRKFDEDIFLKALQDYKMKALALAPPLAVLLAKSPKVLKYDLSSLEKIISGAAPLGKDTELALKERLKNVTQVQQAYGLTEATLIVTQLEDGVNRPGSSGRLAPHLLCKVRHVDSGRSLGPNEVGEICLKGPTVMLGYYNDEKATRETFTSDGWLRTGDLGYYDNEKYFYIVDRLKELIKYKGYQVAPAELEALILNHPKVRDVGVVGMPDELAGELPLAFVVKHEGVEVTEKEIQDYVAGLVSPQKRLRGGVIFVSEIPKSPTGKILRRVIRQQLANYRGQQESKL